MMDLESDFIFDDMCEHIFPVIEEILDKHLSECCGADIIFTDLCQQCKEHCNPREWDQEEICQILVDDHQVDQQQADRIYSAYKMK